MKKLLKTLAGEFAASRDDDVNRSRLMTELLVFVHKY